MSIQRLFQCAAAIAAAGLLLVPFAAHATSDGQLDKLNAPLVTYRMTGVALVHRANGTYREAPLATASLGAGDRIRYLVIATNSTATPQLAGVSLTVPDFTRWDPTDELGSADLVSWSQDDQSWHRGLPSAADAKLAKNVRWVLAEKLRGGLSTAFVFQLKLTGPFADTAGDLNMSRDPESHPLQTLDDSDIRDAQKDAHVSPEIADPLGLSAFFAEKRKLIPHRYTEEQTELAVRNGVEYRVGATAFERNEVGLPVQVPLAQAHLRTGDRVRFTFTAHNAADGPRRAGSTFSLPFYAKFDGASNGGGVIDVSANGADWHSLGSKGKIQPRYVRWTHANELAPGESAQFNVMLTVDRGPTPEQLTQSNAQGSFDPSSAAVIQSILFTHDLTTSSRHEYSGVPIPDQLVRGVKSLALPALPGFVSSGAAPVEEHQPIDPEGNKKVSYIASLAIGIVAALAVIVVLVVRGSNRTYATDTSFARTRGIVFGATSELDQQQQLSRGSSRGGDRVRFVEDLER